MKSLFPIIAVGFVLAGCQTTSSQISIAQPESLQPNTLLNIQVSDDWEIVNDKMVSYANNHKNKLYDYNMAVENDQRWNCESVIRTYPTPDKHRNYFHCQAYYHSQFPSKSNKLQELLLESATTNDVLTVKPTFTYNQEAAYNIPSAVGTFSQVYATYYNYFSYTPEERKIVDDYLVDKLTEQKFPAIVRGETRPCSLENPVANLNKNVAFDKCSHIRLKVSTGQIMLGLRLKNQDLLDLGHKNIYPVLANIDKNGVMILDAGRGSNSFNYYSVYVSYMSLLELVYAPLGYDFFEHTLPHGAKVHEYIESYYNLKSDFKLFAHYSKYNKGALSNPWARVANLTQEQWLETSYAQNSYRHADGDTQFVFDHKRYVVRYMPEELDMNVKKYVGSKMSINQNIGVLPWQLYPMKATPRPKPFSYSLEPKEGNGWRKHLHVNRIKKD